MSSCYTVEAPGFSLAKSLQSIDGFSRGKNQGYSLFHIQSYGTAEQAAEQAGEPGPSRAEAPS